MPTKKAYTENIFTSIINKTAKANIVAENDEFICFKDINPKAKIHLLVVPKIQCVDFSDFWTKVSEGLFRELFAFTMKVISDQRIEQYSLVINNGKEAGQCVFHMHMHIMSNFCIK